MKFWWLNPTTRWQVVFSKIIFENNYLFNSVSLDLSWTTCTMSLKKKIIPICISVCLFVSNLPMFRIVDIDDLLCFFFLFLAQFIDCCLESSLCCCAAMKIEENFQIQSLFLRFFLSNLLNVWFVCALFTTKTFWNTCCVFSLTILYNVK